MNNQTEQLSSFPSPSPSPSPPPPPAPPLPTKYKFHDIKSEIKSNLPFKETQPLVSLDRKIVKQIIWQRDDSVIIEYIDGTEKYIFPHKDNLKRFINNEFRGGASITKNKKIKKSKKNKKTRKTKKNKKTRKSKKTRK